MDIITAGASMTDNIINLTDKVRAIARSAGFGENDDIGHLIEANLEVSERLSQQQDALNTLIRDFADDGIARQFRAEAIKAWRTVAPEFNRAIVWTRRLAIVRDVALMCGAVGIVLLVWLRPTIDIGQVAPQCADAQNLTQHDGGAYCTMRVWVKPPTKGKE